MTAITSVLAPDSAAIRRGGGDLWLTIYQSTMLPYQPHATLKADAAVGATTLTCVKAAGSGVLYVPQQWGSTGSIDIDIFAKSGAAENKAFSALAANAFTNTAIATARSAGSVVKLVNANDYPVAEWKNIGNLAGTKPGMARTADKRYNEKQEKVKVFKGPKDYTLQTNLMQSDKAIIDFLLKEAPGLYFALKYVVPMEDGGNQFTIYKKAQLVESFEVDRNADNDAIISVSFEILKDGSADEYVMWEG